MQPYNAVAVYGTRLHELQKKQNNRVKLKMSRVSVQNDESSVGVWASPTTSGMNRLFAQQLYIWILWIRWHFSFFIVSFCWLVVVCFVQSFHAPTGKAFSLDRLIVHHFQTISLSYDMSTRLFFYTVSICVVCIRGVYLCCNFVYDVFFFCLWLHEWRKSGENLFCIV